MRDSDAASHASTGTIVVQDAANPKNVIIYEPGTQPPPGVRLAPGTAIKVPVN